MQLHNRDTRNLIRVFVFGVEAGISCLHIVTSVQHHLGRIIDVVWIIVVLSICYKFQKSYL